MKRFSLNSSSFIKDGNQIIPSHHTSQMEVAPLHCSLLISHRREDYLRTQKRLKRCKRDSRVQNVSLRAFGAKDVTLFFADEELTKN